jgi:argininosuccinate lyase
MAHITMLESVGLLGKQELELLLAELKSIYKIAVSGSFEIEEGVEDVHSQVELMLTRKLGDVGKKIHSGRSRNDQVLVDLKLFARQEIYDTVTSLNHLFDVLIAPKQSLQGCAFAGIYTFTGSHAVVVRIVVWCLCRQSGRRFTDASFGLEYHQS